MATPSLEPGRWVFHFPAFLVEEDKGKEAGIRVERVLINNIIL